MQKQRPLNNAPLAEVAGLARDLYDALPTSTKGNLAAAAMGTSPPTPLSAAARAFLKTFDGNPRGFTAALHLAHSRVPVLTVQKLYDAVTGKQAQSVSTRATLDALDALPKATPPVKAKALPKVLATEAQGRSVQQVVDLTCDAWDKLDPGLQDSVRRLAFEYQNLHPAHRDTAREPSARAYLRSFDGNPRGFVTAVVLATGRGPSRVTASAIERLHADVVGKAAEHNNVVAVARAVTAARGDSYGLDQGSTGARRPPAPPPAPPPATIEEGDVLVGGHVVLPTPPAPADIVPPATPDLGRHAWDTFSGVLLHLVEDLAAQNAARGAAAPRNAPGGVRVHKVGSSYVATLPDGTVVQVSRYGTPARPA